MPNEFIPIIRRSFDGNELKYVTECIKTGWISSQGSFVKRFEGEFAQFCGAKFGVATANGTVALHLALEALGIKEGDEVIVPDLTFAATANAVVYTGATPMFVDSEKSTWNIDPSKIVEVITQKTKAIIPVHLYGHPCDMDPIMKLAKEHGLHVIEDVAEAPGAEYKGRKLGSIGDIGCFSFFGNKIITTGEGGMCTCNDEKLVEKMRVLRDHGMNKDRRYWHKVIGYNYRLTNIQAAIGVAQLERIDDFIKRKRELAARYNKELSGVNGIVTPPEAKWAKNVYWMYSILVDDSAGFRTDRDTLAKELKEAGIDSRQFFHPMSVMPPYKGYAEGKTFPVASELSRKGLNLPSSTDMTAEEIKRIADLIKEGKK